MEKIIEGVLRFQREVFPKLKHEFRLLADRQKPQALFITCADSRIVPSLITQTEPGDLFICRNVGNMVPPFGVSNGGNVGTIEYAVEVLGVKHIIVCGHSDCGAMKGVLNPDRVAGLPAVANWLRYGAVARRLVLSQNPRASEPELLLRLAQQNVVAQITHLRTHPCVAAALANRNLELHGWMYHISTGIVEVYDADSRQFRQPGATETSA
jgi:carbonic anhydrase